MVPTLRQRRVGTFHSGARMHKPILLLTLLLAGCASDYRGHVVYGTESMQFVDCRTGEWYWLGRQEGDPDQWQAVHAIVNDRSGCEPRWNCPTPWAPVAVLGKRSAAGAYGPFGQEGRKLDIVQITLLTAPPCAEP